MRAQIEKSVQGFSHIRKGKECQDSCGSHTQQDGTRILAVADGHGSEHCPYSAEGSKIACEVFLALMGRLYRKYEEAGNLMQLMQLLNREGNTALVRKISREWQERVLERHDEAGRPFPKKKSSDGVQSDDELAVYRLYGTTLLGLLIAQDFVFALQIGDGDIGYVDDTGFSKVVEGEKLLGVETYSLSSPDVWKNAVSAVRSLTEDRRLPAMFVLTTDGFANSFSSDEAYERSCEDYFRTLSEYGPATLEKYLPEWLSETSKGGCGDDITMSICYDYPEDMCFAEEPQEEEPEPKEPEAEEQPQFAENAKETILPAETQAEAPAETESGAEQNEAPQEAAQPEETASEPVTAPDETVAPEEPAAETEPCEETVPDDAEPERKKHLRDCWAL